MPADSRSTSASRTSSRKLTSEEEIELKRARGEISCAECRRSKLKCDRVRLDLIASIKLRTHRNNHINLSKLHAALVYAGDARVFVQTARSPPSLVQGVYGGSIHHRQMSNLICSDSVRPITSSFIAQYLPWASASAS